MKILVFKIFVLLICAFSVSCGECIAQKYIQTSDKIVPSWINKQPSSRNTSIQYVLVPVNTTNLTSASTLALNELVRFLPRDWNISSVEEINQIHRSHRDASGLSGTKDEVYTLELRAEGVPIDIECKMVDNYWRQLANGNYQAYYLYQVAAPGSIADFDETSVTTKYGARGLWRSAIVPGWGQFHKGSYLKGGLILGGTAALIGGVVATETIKTDYARRIGETHDADYKRLYAKRVDQFSTARNICLGALGALYVYNLIDAIAAPGARRVVVKEKGSSGSRYASYSFYPTSPDGMSVAMAFNLTF